MLALVYLQHRSWPTGRLAQMPFRQKEGRLWGPGVLDMKSGIGIFSGRHEGAARAPHSGFPPCLLQLNGDEEVGSHSSRALTEKNAAQSDVVLVLEPGTAVNGRRRAENSKVSWRAGGAVDERTVEELPGRIERRGFGTI